MIVVSLILGQAADKAEAAWPNRPSQNGAREWHGLPGLRTVTAGLWTQRRHDSVSLTMGAIERARSRVSFRPAWSRDKED